MFKPYKIGFDLGGFILLLILMLPNFVWFFMPLPDDILRKQSTTTSLDIIASICQVLMIFTLCFIKNENALKFKFKSPLILIVFLSNICYYITWIVYYGGTTNARIILSLSLLPCISFIIYEIDRRNYIAFFPTIIFLVCHTVIGIMNYIL